MISEKGFFRSNSSYSKQYVLWFQRKRGVKFELKFREKGQFSRASDVGAYIWQWEWPTGDSSNDPRAADAHFSLQKNEEFDTLIADVNLQRNFSEKDGHF